MTTHDAPPVLTPEHLQLLSTARLEATARVRDVTDDRAPAPADDRDFARLARRELARRQGAGDATPR